MDLPAQVVYPRSVLSPRQPDEMFEEEARAFAAAGCGISLVDLDRLDAGPVPVRPALDPEPVLYRGWMVRPAEYDRLCESIGAAGATPFTSAERYAGTHHLPNWYSLLADLTPETVFLSPEDDLVEELRALGWSRFFVKDHVKSLKTSVGSLIHRPEDVELLVSEMERFRGEIEGGLAVRRVEAFVDGAETRYFVLRSKAHAPDPETAIPEVVKEAARRVDSPFFSVDVAHRSDGGECIVEIGDGQVSDLVGWTIPRFVGLWSS